MTELPEELAALTDAGVPYTVRKPEDAPAPDALEGERDIEVAARDAARLERALAAAGWRRVHTLDGGHLFFVKVERGLWRKLDVKVRPPRRSPAFSLRRRAPVVAFMGPDGAGKSTLVTELSERIPLGVRVAYLGGGGSPARSVPRPPRGATRQVAGVCKDAGRAARRLLREHWAALRGSIVLCDRHPKELLAVRPARHRVAAGLERFLVRRLFPAPDAYVVLEAPAEILRARKPEHPLERLDAWAAAYRDEFGPEGATFVDTSGGRDESFVAASEAVWSALVRRGGS